MGGSTASSRPSRRRLLPRHAEVIETLGGGGRRGIHRVVGAWLGAVVGPCGEHVAETVELDGDPQELEDGRIVRGVATAIEGPPQLGPTLLQHLVERMERRVDPANLLEHAG